MALINLENLKITNYSNNQIILDLTEKIVDTPLTPFNTCCYNSQFPYTFDRISSNFGDINYITKDTTMFNDFINNSKPSINCLGEMHKFLIATITY